MSNIEFYNKNKHLGIFDAPKLVIKICINEWKNESRDKKELAVCRDLGADIKVVAKGKQGDCGKEDYVDGYEVHRLSTRPLRMMPVLCNRIASIFTWAKYVHGMNADIISGHDISGLTIAWLSNFFKAKENKAKLIYDSHEFEIGRNVKRNRFQIWMVTVWERFLIGKSEFMIVVNDSIADEVTRIHKLKKRPVVVRNIPPRWNIDEKECMKIRRQFLADFGREGTLLMYHGAIGSGRGIEDCLKILTFDDNLFLILMGTVQSLEYKLSLDRFIEKYDLKDRVKLYDPVSYNLLWKYVGAVDIEMVMVQPVVKSYFFGLPNKLFEAIQAHVPVIATDLPEIRRIVNGYKVGELCNIFDVMDAYRAVKKLLDNAYLRNEYIENEKVAANELCWEVESDILRKEYRKLLLDL